MERPSCPQCGAEKFVTGQCGDAEGTASFFIPTQTRRFRLKVGVPLAMGFSACLSCGHVWGSIAPSSLRWFIEKYGTPVAQQNLDRLETGVMQGLPETEPNRQIAANLAALDRLVLSGEAANLSGELRRMMGVTWEEAIKATRKWEHLTRDEKLKRLGWAAKPGRPVDDLAEPLL